MFEKEAEEIEKEAIKWVKDVLPNDEFKQSGISRALVEFAELGYNKANERLIKAKEIVELEKENAELKEQIEQMKCCENCCYYSRTYEHCYSYDSYQNCKALSNWRLAE